MNYWWHSLWGTEHLPAFMKLKKLRWVSAMAILHTAQSQADSKQFHDIMPCWGSLISCMLSQFCLYMVIHHLDLQHISASERHSEHSRTEFNNFSNHILFILFKGGDKNSAQSKWQQYWSHRKNSSKCDLQRMFSGPWESKEGIQALLFQDTLSLCLTCL